MTEAKRKQAEITLARLVRRTRLKLGLNREALAGPDFSVQYIAALERGTVYPSALALQTLARRLNLSPEELQAVLDESLIIPDPDAQIEDLNYQLNVAKGMGASEDLEDVLAIIQKADESVEPYREQIPPSTLYRISFLRGRAYARQGKHIQARLHLETALEIARGDKLAMVTVRNLLGAALYLQEHVQEALEHHLYCLYAIQSGVVKDLSLRLSIYRNLANDYLVTNDLPHAIAIYKEALATLEDLNDPDRMAGALWGLAMAYKAQGDLAYAKLYAKRALDIYEQMDRWPEAAAMSLTLAEMLTRDYQFDESEELLKRAQGVLDIAGDKPLLGLFYKIYAELEHRRGRREQASLYTAMSLGFTEEAHRRAEEEGKSRRDAIRAHAEGLWMAAQIAEDQGNREFADIYFATALDWINQVDFEEIQAKISSSYAEALSKRGDYERAVQYYHAALRLRNRSTSLSQ